jgi:cobalamin 5'-phosphate synthase/cobalamin synthase
VNTSLYDRWFTALAFLTRIPVREADATPEAIGRSTSLFPLVGAALGVVNLLVLWIVRRLLPSTLTATVMALTGILLTGALHFDGLADMADGFGGGRTRDDVLRIMRDHHIGTYGAIALVLTLLSQVVAIASLIERDIAGRAVIIAPTVSRWAMVVLAWRLPYARPEEAGLGRALTDHVRDRDVWGSTSLVLVIAVVVAGWSGIVSLGVTAMLTAGLGLVCWRRIGGLTGDTLGADAVLCETIVYIAAIVSS